jgi:hypothetical protein
MPNIPEQKNRRLFLIWEHCDVVNKTFSRIFLKNAWKPKFHTDVCPGKGVPIRRAKWNWYISCIDKRWKIYLKMNLLYEWAVWFLKGKPHEFVRFFFLMKLTFFSILCQLYYLFVLHKTVFRLNWVQVVFSCVSVISMSWLGYPNELFDLWKPDDDRNCTCFFMLAIYT